MSTSTVAFFGATGGCAGFCLADTLNAGYHCTALARTPAKLTKAMLEKGVSSSTLDQQLTIIEGNVKDIQAVKRALQLNGRVVDKIVNGVGALPVLRWSLTQPVTLDDPTICQDAGTTILEALQALNSTTKPLLISVSTTGIPPRGKPWDVPFALSAIYRYGLQVPHHDKEVLQENLAEHVKLPESQRGCSAYVLVKASLLMDGPGYGLEKVREGSEDQPAVGYTIRRRDVGAWMFDRLIKNDMKPEWENKGVCITY